MFIYFERKSGGLKGSLVSRKEKRVLLARRSAWLEPKESKLTSRLTEVQKRPQKSLDRARKKLNSKEQLPIRPQRLAPLMLKHLSTSNNWVKPERASHKRYLKNYSS